LTGFVICSVFFHISSSASWWITNGSEDKQNPYTEISWALNKQILAFNDEDYLVISKMAVRILLSFLTTWKLQILQHIYVNWVFQNWQK
jgi:hypothetical protein